MSIRDQLSAPDKLLKWLKTADKFSLLVKTREHQMQNPFVPQPNDGSYINLRKRMFQSVQSASINDEIISIIKKALEAENIVLSRPERKRLFSQIVQLVSEDLTKKLEDDSISI